MNRRSGGGGRGTGLANGKYPSHRALLMFKNIYKKNLGAKKNRHQKTSAQRKISHKQKSFVDVFWPKIARLSVTVWYRRLTSSKEYVYQVWAYPWAVIIVKAQKPLFPTWPFDVTWLSVSVQMAATMEAAVLPVWPDAKLRRRLWSHLLQHTLSLPANTLTFELCSLS